MKTSDFIHISDVIKYLEEIKDKHGDVFVTYAIKEKGSSALGVDIKMRGLKRIIYYDKIEDELVILDRE